MDEIIEIFFDHSFEDSITEEMLEYGYIFPTTKLEDYVISIISTPYSKFIDFVHEHICPKRIDSAAEIPQTSSYDLCTFGVCKMLNAIKDPGVTLLDFGRFLYLKDKRNVNYKDIENYPIEQINAFAQEYGIFVEHNKETYMCLDGKFRNKGAIVKIAENQLKGADFHGLVYELGGKWFLTSIGRVYSSLDEEMQHALSARTLLRKPFYWLVMAEAVDHEVDIRQYIQSVCNGSTIKRRLSSSQNFFDVCIEQCRNYGLEIHRIFSLELKETTKTEVSHIFQVLEKDVEYYKYLFARMHTAKFMGESAPHNAVLLLAVMDLISQGTITSPEIFLNDDLIEKFKEIWREKVPLNLSFKCDIGQPFFHMQNESFWSLLVHGEEYNTLTEELGLYSSNRKEIVTSYATSALRKKFRCARIDQELFDCLLNADARNCLREVLVEKYCTFN